MSHRGPYSEHEMMRSLCDMMNNPLKPLQVLENESYMCRLQNESVRLPRDSRKWELKSRKIKFVANAKKPFCLPFEIVCEITKHIEAGLMDTLRNLRLVSNGFKSAVDMRIFRLMKIDRESMCNMVPSASFSACRIVSIVSPSFCGTHLPSKRELVSFANLCSEEPLFVGSTPQGHIFVGWGSEGTDEKAASCLQSLFELRRPIWPRENATGANGVNMTLICYAPKLADCLVDAIRGAASLAREHNWPVYENFVVLVYRRMDTTSRLEHRASVSVEHPYWRKLEKEMRHQSIIINVRYMSPFYIA